MESQRREMQSKAEKEEYTLSSSFPSPLTIQYPSMRDNSEGNSALITEWSRRRVRNGSEGLHQEGGGGDREERME